MREVTVGLYCGEVREVKVRTCCGEVRDVRGEVRVRA